MSEKRFHENIHILMSTCRIWLII